MSDAASGGGKKLTTAEILAAARAQAGKAGGNAPTSAAPPVSAEAKPAEAPAATEPNSPPSKPVAPAPAKKPTSTAEILAAARAQTAKASGAAETPAAPAPVPAAPAAAAKPATGAPKSTADILAAARAAAAAKSGGSAPAALTTASGDKPKSTADILAAARAGKAGAAGGEVPAPAKPKPAPKVAEAGAPGADTGEKIPVAEMLAKLRAAGTAAAPAAAPIAKAAEAQPIVPPPMPVRPEPQVKLKKPVSESRRWALWAIVATPFALAWTMFAATTVAATLGTLRFMFPNIITEPPRKFKVGPPSDFDLGTVSTKFVASSAIWLVHTDQYKGRNMIYALSSVCTHLGCTPSWLEGEQKFKCPCHGSGFYITGINFEGPAPRPLERHAIRLAADGMLEVDKSFKFQEEMGQWEDPASYIEVT